MGRESVAGRMIENGDAECLAINGPKVIDPGRRLAPGVRVIFSFAGNDFAPLFGVNFHRTSSPNAKTSFFGIAKNDIAIAGFHRDICIDISLVFAVPESISPDVFAMFFALGTDPIVGR